MQARIADIHAIVGCVLRVDWWGEGALHDGYFSQVGSSIGTYNSEGSAGTTNMIHFDASYSNSLYGKSNTVTPESIHTKFFIRYM